MPGFVCASKQKHHHSVIKATTVNRKKYYRKYHVKGRQRRPFCLIRFLHFVEPVTNKAHDRKRRKHQVDDAGIQPLGWFMAQLLCRFGTDGTLTPGCFHAEDEETEHQNHQKPLHIR
jgi:hypothetical protein